MRTPPTTALYTLEVLLKNHASKRVLLIIGISLRIENTHKYLPKDYKQILPSDNRDPGLNLMAFCSAEKSQ